jgi:hypothetical protein
MPKKAQRKRNEAIIEVAILYEDGTFQTRIISVDAYPHNNEAVERAKDAWATKNLPKEAIWCVTITNHYALEEILEGLDPRDLVGHSRHGNF